MTTAARNTRPLRAFSLLEMLMAAALVTGTVVPALAVIRDAMGESREMHARKLLSNFAVLLIEEQCAYAAMHWTNATDSDTLAAQGYSDLAYDLRRTDSATYGGIVGRLMHIEVTVFDDRNGDLIPDSNELQVTFRTKVARLNTYENEET